MLSNGKKALVVFLLYYIKGENIMRLLRDVRDVEAFKAAVKKCAGDVIVRHNSRHEEFNMKSLFSEYIGLANLMSEHGDEYEVFCMNPNDERFMLQFFQELKENNN
jgi:hypothetical protein